VFARTTGPSSSLFTSYRLMPSFVVACFVMAALVSGVVTATGNLMASGLVVGAILGILMLSAVESVIWIVLLGTLLISGPLMLFQPQLTRVTWVFSILGFFLTIAAIAHAGTARLNTRPPQPAFIPLLILFSLCGVVSLFFSEGTSSEAFSAVKRNFQFLGVALALAVVPFSTKTIRHWMLLILLLALAQVPFALYQRIALVPLRINLPNRVVPVDIVAGTFEAAMFGGGNSNIMAFLILVVLAGLVCAYRERVLSGVRTLLLAGATAIPLGLGETKMVLALLPVALFAIFSDLIRKRPALFAIGSLMSGLLLVGLFYVYVAVQNHDTREMTFEQKVQENFDYNFGELGYYEGPSLNRTTVVKFWWDKNGSDNPVRAAFGYGLGSSYSAPGSDNPGFLSFRYSGHTIDLTGVSTLLWDLGAFGLLLFCLILWSAWNTCRLLIERSDPGLDRAFCRTLSASVIMIAVLFLASSAMFWAPSMETLMMFTFGLIAWRWRHQDRREA
jgi:hypothetical protein